MNKLKPGIIKRLNRLSTPIAGLVCVCVFVRVGVCVCVCGCVLTHYIFLWDMFSDGLSD